MVIVDITAIFVLLGQMTSMSGRSLLIRGENILVTSIIQQKMLLVKDAKVTVIRSRISNAKPDLVQKQKAWRAVLNAMNSHARR